MAKRRKSLKSVDDLKPAPWNPREISESALGGLEKSLASFGDLSGIVWSEDSGHLLAGHQRLKALKNKYGDGLKLEDGALVAPDGNRYPVRVVSGWTDVQEKEANVVANSMLLQGEFTPELAGILAEIGEVDAEGFEDFLLDDLNDTLGAWGLTEETQHERPTFEDLTDQFSDKGDPVKCTKNENWFYVEYYQDDEKYSELSRRLSEHMAGQGGHEIDSDFFWGLVCEQG